MKLYDKRNNQEMCIFEPYKIDMTYELEDTPVIVNYLEKRGRVYVKDTTIAMFYRMFSNSVCDAGWMGVSEDTLLRFSDWLDSIDL